MIKNVITRQSLAYQLTSATQDLLQMARKHAWNNIPDNCLYILTKIEHSNEHPYEQYAQRKLNNDQKQPQPLINIIPVLLDIYDDLYDINLYIYHASKNRTVIEIAWYAKSMHDEAFRQTVIDNNPMLHCKVPIPMYSGFKSTKKFDINWQRNTLRHQWSLFWYRLKHRLGLSKFNPV